MGDKIILRNQLVHALDLRYYPICLHPIFLRGEVDEQTFSVSDAGGGDRYVTRTGSLRPGRDARADAASGY
jgi:hypothetical protein